MPSGDFSLTLFWIAVCCYLAALLALIVHLPVRRRLIADVGLGFAVLGWPFHLGSIVSRAIISQHWPLGNMYEYSTGISFVIVTTFLVLAIRARVRLAGIPAMVFAVALMGVAYMLYVPPGNLVPALHSYWLTIHVTAMASSSGILSFSFVFGMAYLARRWADARLLATAAGSSGGGSRPGAMALATEGGAVGGAIAAGPGGGTGLARSLARLLP
ncbi:MAG: hypothetical protein M3010_06640, partial [Candidatus Dormibacteraeota bacterium]|nr:hypothetical protein [Candidatus Dormibacteraeota bacterium]